MVDPELINVNWMGGWGCKPKRGGDMGVITIAKYEQQIYSLFEIGRAYSGKKMSAAMMRKAFKIAEHSKYIIPSEQQILANLSTLYRQLKQNDIRNAVLTYSTIVYGK